MQIFIQLDQKCIFLKKKSLLRECRTNITHFFKQLIISTEFGGGIKTWPQEVHWKNWAEPPSVQPSPALEETTIPNVYWVAHRQISLWWGVHLWSGQWRTPFLEAQQCPWPSWSHTRCLHHRAPPDWSFLPSSPSLSQLSSEHQIQTSAIL